MRHKRAFRGDVTMPAGLLPELLTFQRYIPTVHDADKTHLALESTATGQISRLDEIIISLYAGGMTVRDIDHLLATRGSAPSSPSRRPARWARCPRWSPPTGIVVKVRDGANVGNRAAHTPSGSTRTASGASWGSGFSPVRARKFWVSVWADLANRDVSVPNVCCDGLTGPPGAIEATTRDPPSAD